MNKNCEQNSAKNHYNSKQQTLKPLLVLDSEGDSELSTLQQLQKNNETDNFDDSDINITIQHEDKEGLDGQMQSKSSLQQQIDRSNQQPMQAQAQVVGVALSSQRSLQTDSESVACCPQIYEKLIQDLEADVRQHIRIQQQLKLHIEGCEERIEELESEQERDQAQFLQERETLAGQITSLSQQNKALEEECRQKEDKNVEQAKIVELIQKEKEDLQRECEAVRCQNQAITQKMQASSFLLNRSFDEDQAILAGDLSIESIQRDNNQNNYSHFLKSSHKLAAGANTTSTNNNLLQQMQQNSSCDNFNDKSTARKQQTGADRSSFMVSRKMRDSRRSSSGEQHHNHPRMKTNNESSNGNRRRVSTDFEFLERQMMMKENRQVQKSNQAIGSKFVKTQMKQQNGTAHQTKQLNGSKASKKQQAPHVLNISKNNLSANQKQIDLSIVSIRNDEQNGGGTDEKKSNQKASRQFLSATTESQQHCWQRHATTTKTSISAADPLQHKKSTHTTTSSSNQQNPNTNTLQKQRLQIQQTQQQVLAGKLAGIQGGNGGSQSLARKNVSKSTNQKQGISPRTMVQIHQNNMNSQQELVQYGRKSPLTFSQKLKWQSNQSKVPARFGGKKDKAQSRQQLRATVNNSQNVFNQSLNKNNFNANNHTTNTVNADNTNYNNSTSLLSGSLGGVATRIVGSLEREKTNLMLPSTTNNIATSFKNANNDSFSSHPKKIGSTRKKYHNQTRPPHQIKQHAENIGTADNLTTSTNNVMSADEISSQKQLKKQSQSNSVGRYHKFSGQKLQKSAQNPQNAQTSRSVERQFATESKQVSQSTAAQNLKQVQRPAALTSSKLNHGAFLSSDTAANGTISTGIDLDQQSIELQRFVTLDCRGYKGLNNPPHIVQQQTIQRQKDTTNGLTTLKKDNENGRDLKVGNPSSQLKQMYNTNKIKQHNSGYCDDDLNENEEILISESLHNEFVKAQSLDQVQNDGSRFMVPFSHQSTNNPHKVQNQNQIDKSQEIRRPRTQMQNFDPQEVKGDMVRGVLQQATILPHTDNTPLLQQIQLQSTTSQMEGFKHKNSDYAGPPSGVQDYLPTAGRSVSQLLHNAPQNNQYNFGHLDGNRQMTSAGIAVQQAQPQQQFSQSIEHYRQLDLNNFVTETLTTAKQVDNNGSSGMVDQQIQQCQSSSLSSHRRCKSQSPRGGGIRQMNSEEPHSGINEEGIIHGTNQEEASFQNIEQTQRDTNGLEVLYWSQDPKIGQENKAFCDQRNEETEEEKTKNLVFKLNNSSSGEVPTISEIQMTKSKPQIQKPKKKLLPHNLPINKKNQAILPQNNNNVQSEQTLSKQTSNRIEQSQLLVQNVLRDLRSSTQNNQNIRQTTEFVGKLSTLQQANQQNTNRTQASKSNAKSSLASSGRQTQLRQYEEILGLMPKNQKTHASKSILRSQGQNGFEDIVQGSHRKSTNSQKLHGSGLKRAKSNKRNAVQNQISNSNRVAGDLLRKTVTNSAQKQQNQVPPQCVQSQRNQMLSEQKNKLTDAQHHNSLVNQKILKSSETNNSSKVGTHRSRNLKFKLEGSQKVPNALTTCLNNTNASIMNSIGNDDRLVGSNSIGPASRSGNKYYLGKNCGSSIRALNQHDGLGGKTLDERDFRDKQFRSNVVLKNTFGSSSSFLSKNSAYQQAANGTNAVLRIQQQVLQNQTKSGKSIALGISSSINGGVCDVQNQSAYVTTASELLRGFRSTQSIPIVKNTQAQSQQVSMHHQMSRASRDSSGNYRSQGGTGIGIGTTSTGQNAQNYSKQSINKGAGDKSIASNMQAVQRQAGSSSSGIIMAAGRYLDQDSQQKNGSQQGHPTTATAANMTSQNANSTVVQQVLPNSTIKGLKKHIVSSHQATSTISDSLAPDTNQSQYQNKASSKAQPNKQTVANLAALAQQVVGVSTKGVNPQKQLSNSSILGNNLAGQKKVGNSSQQQQQQVVQLQQSNQSQQFSLSKDKKRSVEVSSASNLIGGGARIGEGDRSINHQQHPHAVTSGGALTTISSAQKQRCGSYANISAQKAPKSLNSRVHGGGGTGGSTTAKQSPDNRKQAQILVCLQNNQDLYQQAQQASQQPQSTMPVSLGLGQGQGQGKSNALIMQKILQNKKQTKQAN